jgi:glycosyltransferase involved in cell wall biosynthesis
MRVTDGLRAVASLGPVVGLVSRPEPRPNGISAVVRVKGEEEWIEPCLLSLRHFADEILVLDNGASPETRTTLDRLKGSLGAILQVTLCPQLDLFQVSNHGLKLARFRWVIRWDADFVAHTDGPGDIQNLRRYLLRLDSRRYYVVSVAASEVAGDLFHQFPDLRVRHDGQAAIWSSGIGYVAVHRIVAVHDLATPDRVLRADGSVSRTLESLKTPCYYRSLCWEHPAYFHVNVKSARHMLLRHFWLEWLDASLRGTVESREEYVSRRAQEEWKVPGLAEAEHCYVTAYCKQLATFDARRCGPYPELLKPYLREPRYLVEYRDGTIIGRHECTGPP